MIIIIIYNDLLLCIWKVLNSKSTFSKQLNPPYKFSGVMVTIVAIPLRLGPV